MQSQSQINTAAPVVGDLDIEDIKIGMEESHFESEMPKISPIPAHTGNGVQPMTRSYDDERVSKGDIVNLLEGFVKILKSDAGSSSSSSALTTVCQNLPTELRYDIKAGGQARLTEIQIDDRTAEIEGLRNLVIEAQDTIIKLLTDRVEDRAKIAALESQLKLLPDLQAQADRAMAVAIRTEEYRSDLTKVKFELDRFRLHRVRTEVEAKKGTVWTKVQRFFLKKFSNSFPSMFSDSRPEDGTVD